MSRFKVSSLDLHMGNLENEKRKGCKSFLKFIHKTYASENSFDLTEDLLADNKINHTIRTKFARIFHPDKARIEPQQVQ